MIKFKIVDVVGYDYVLEGNNGVKKYLNIEFQGVQIKPKIGDYMYTDDKMFTDKNLSMYTFGMLKEDMVEEDLIKVVSDNQEYYLQRYYG